MNAKRRRSMSGELGKAMAQMSNTDMPLEQLEEHIASTLKEVRMCALVTSKDDIPRGTPLEYFSDGLTLYMTTDPGTKTRNLEVNPNVSASIYNNVSPDWEKESDADKPTRYASAGDSGFCRVIAESI